MENKKRISDGLNQAADAAKAAADKAKKGAQAAADKAKKGAQAAADKAAAAAKSAQESVKEELEEIQDFTTPRTKRINTAWMWILLVIICGLVIVWIMPDSCTRERGSEKAETVAAALEQGDTVGAPHTLTAAEADAAAAKAAEADAAENAVDARETADGAVAGAAPVDPAAAAALDAKGSAGASASAADLSSASADELARRVLRGEFGDNPDRRAALGSRYSEVQSRVNALLK